MRILISVFLLMSMSLHAQEQNIHTTYYLRFNIGQQQKAQHSPFAFTAIALKSNLIDDFTDFAFIDHGDTIQFVNDLHKPEHSSHHYSALIHFEEEMEEIIIIHPEKLTGVEVVLINGSGVSDMGRRKLPKYNQNNCELEGVIPQTEWRAGLPGPSFNRSFTATNHMIVHHSAGSNNVTNYTQAVRDIYILHTEENGWSDIGYNYLVAPDGVVYAGRDPAGGKQDEVLGAHFCGSNSNAMGVCLLGNYQTVIPSNDMLGSLENVLAWKAFKDDLEVLESNRHPLNVNLGVIAAHRDGCNTLCPGENVYVQLNRIRNTVAEQVARCSQQEGGEEPVFVVEIDSLVSDKLYPNPIRNDFSFSLNLNKSQQDELEKIWIFNPQGQRIKWQNLFFRDHVVEVKLPYSLKPGMYLLQTFYAGGKTEVQRFLIR